MLHRLKKFLPFLKSRGSGKLDHISLGKLGEDFAVQHLKEKNYGIIERNYTCRFGELDIVARDKNVTVFAEVKSQYSYVSVKPERKIDFRKRKKLCSLARYYKKSKLNKNASCRIDVIIVYISRDNRVFDIKHYPNALEVRI